MRVAETSRKTCQLLGQVPSGHSGAIRLDTPYELQTVKRISNALRMQPVGTDNLVVAGLLMHATCFRPISVLSLDRKPFGVFRILLRPELLFSDEVRNLSLNLLGDRKIFTDKPVGMLSTAESQNGRLIGRQAEMFVPEGLLTFSWRPVAASTFSRYNVFKAEHPILTDVACFQSTHINHLTSALSIYPLLRCLCRHPEWQSSHALRVRPVENVIFSCVRRASLPLRKPSGSGQMIIPRAWLHHLKKKSRLIEASHKGRFGDIEERGAAVTVKGRSYTVDFWTKLCSKAKLGIRLFCVKVGNGESDVGC